MAASSFDLMTTFDYIKDQIVSIFVGFLKMFVGVMFEVPPDPDEILGDLEEVKVVVPSDEDEKKDAEKPDPCHLKYLNRLKEGRNVCQQKYNALERYGQSN